MPDAVNAFHPRWIPNIQLDLFPYCNAKCKFCSYHDSKRKRGVMSEEVLKKTIESVRDWLANPRGDIMRRIEVMPFYYGEPFLNKQWFERFTYIDENLPMCSMSVSTNGSLIDQEKVENLASIKTLGFVNFSVYSGVKEEYEDLMGLPFEKTMENIHGAIDYLRKTRPEVRLCVGGTADPRYVSSESINNMCKTFGTLYSPHRISFNRQHVGGKNVRTVPDSEPCYTPFATMVIMSNGDVGICCFDVDCELKVGNVMQNSLRDINNSHLMRCFKNTHLMGYKDAIPLCRGCTHPQ